MFFVDKSYCAICDKDFPTPEARAAHVQLSANHPKCTICNRHFADRNSLRTHYVYSPRHHYCATCEVDFSTAASFCAHLETAAIHRDGSDFGEEDGHSSLHLKDDSWIEDDEMNSEDFSDVDLDSTDDADTPGGGGVLVKNPVEDEELAALSPAEPKSKPEITDE